MRLKSNFLFSDPAWAKKLEGELSLGKTLVTFQAMSPISDESASCSFAIHVRDTVPPRVYNCPEDFKAHLVRRFPQISRKKEITIEFEDFFKSCIRKGSQNHCFLHSLLTHFAFFKIQKLNFKNTNSLSYHMCESTIFFY